MLIVVVPVKVQVVRLVQSPITNVLVEIKAYRNNTLIKLKE